MSYFYTSLSDNVVPQIVGYNFAHEIWSALNKMYASFSMARLSEIKTQLQNLKKEGMTAMDYIQKLKSLCNTLTSTGEPVSCKDHLFYMFNCLDK